MDFDTVYNFGKKADVLTYEIELVNVKALEQLEKEGVKVFPSSKTLRTIQNKATQKLFYVDHEIPTAPFTRSPTLVKYYLPWNMKHFLFHLFGKAPNSGMMEWA